MDETLMPMLVFDPDDIWNAPFYAINTGKVPLPRVELDFDGLCDRSNFHVPAQREIHEIEGDNIEPFPADQDNSTTHHSRDLVLTLAHRPGGHVCSICKRVFSYRSAMVRHERTVHRLHRPKVFPCPECARRFARKDVFDRHMEEQHGSISQYIDCNSCGKRIVKRYLPQHLESQACRRPRAVTYADNLDKIGFLLVDQDQDCFLMAIRVFRAWFIPTALAMDRRHAARSTTLEINVLEPRRFSRAMASNKWYTAWYRYETKAISSLRNENSKKPLAMHNLRLYCAAMLFLFVSSFRLGLVSEAHTMSQGTGKGGKVV